jgi:hypothetical protein
MCEPMTIALSMAALSAAMADKQGKEAAAAQDQAHEDNKAMANASAMNEHRSLNQQINQEQEAAAAEKQTNKLEGMRALSTARTSAGESGVAGGAVDSLLRDIHRQNSTRTLAIDRNLDMATSQNRVNQEASEIGRQSRINSVAKPKFNSSLNFANAALTGASTGLSTYGGAKAAGIGTQ